MATVPTDKAQLASERTKSDSIVSLRNISKVYGNGTTAIKDFSLEVAEGEFVTIIGPSGCGKSTVLRIISGLSEVSSGSVIWQDSSQYNENGAADHEMSFVFQEPTLMPWATVFGNVHLPLKLKGISKKSASPDINEALELVGLAEFAQSYPRELSGGMKMRVSIARALVTKPKLLLMDEPFAALDEINRFKLNNDLLELWQKFGWTLVFVTHSVFESVYLSNRIVVMSARPGKIVDDIEIDVPYPRADSFRTLPDYHELCKRTSSSLHAAIGIGSQTKNSEDC